MTWHLLRNNLDIAWKLPCNPMRGSCHIVSGRVVICTLSFKAPKLLLLWQQSSRFTVRQKENLWRDVMNN